METQSRAQPCYEDGALVHIYRGMKARTCIISLSHYIPERIELSFVYLKVLKFINYIRRWQGRKRFSVII